MLKLKGKASRILAITLAVDITLGSPIPIVGAVAYAKGGAAADITSGLKKGNFLLDIGGQVLGTASGLIGAKAVQSFSENNGEETDTVREEARGRVDSLKGQADELVNGGSHPADFEAVQSAVGSARAQVENMIANPLHPVEPDTPSVSNGENLQNNATESDLAIERAVSAGLGPKKVLKKATLDENGKITYGDMEKEKENESLTETNQAILREAFSKQENANSSTPIRTYTVQTPSGKAVVLTKNPCFQKNTEACTRPYQYSYVDSNGNTQIAQSLMNIPEYLSSDSSRVTSDMIEQAKRQEAYVTATDSLLDNGDKAATPIEMVTSSVRDMIASGADAKDAIMSGLMTMFTQKQSEDTLDKMKEYGRSVEKIQQEKDNVSYKKAEEAQKRAGVLSYKQNKRFTVRLSPMIPVVNSGTDIKAVLVTPSKKPNKDSDYTIMVRLKNQNTGKYETFPVYENIPFVVEKKGWTTNPGVRHVQVFYSPTNNAQKETYGFSYKVGQLSTAILPDGRNVSNSVTSLAGNADILNYGMSGQAVAGRIKGLEFKDGICYMELTDAKDDTNVDYPSVVVSTDKIPQEQCTGELRDKYVTMANVSARYNDNGEYLFIDNSDGDGMSIMTEAEYDALESADAKSTQEAGNSWDNNVFKVNKDGTIYEGLPGVLGQNFLNLSIGNGNNVNVAISVDTTTGEYRFSKADGTPYSNEELLSKGIDPSTISFGIDENKTVYAYDTKTGKLLSNAFSANDTSPLSRVINDGNTGFPVGTMAFMPSGNGTILSTFKSAVDSSKRFLSSITSNLSTLSSGTFAGLTGSSYYTSSPMAKETRSAAEKEAAKLCQAVPDRCEEAFKLANK